ncbi:TonB-like protein [Dysgonomonas alginatilytica]|uniref:TonB-like protein n=1 Tax=Dysgonomonas alginatilytica TaxID=1605892 RepID=A0A2V3PTA6_9BACT|nr:energy transducer TonB [Dysgonomonas alginatilytica]PXV68930.1 TonB-like protein [Dysgonomonas alginatilytica]
MFRRKISKALNTSEAAIIKSNATIIKLIKMRLLCLFTFSLICFYSFGQIPVMQQKEVTQEDKDSLVFTLFNRDKAEYIDGYTELHKFIRENLQYPPKALQKKLETKIAIHFIVAKNGTLSDYKCYEQEYPDAGFKEEAIRIIELTSGRWNPGTYEGQPVRSRESVYIDFKLTDK